MITTTIYLENDDDTMYFKAKKRVENDIFSEDMSI